MTSQTRSFRPLCSKLLLLLHSKTASIFLPAQPAWTFEAPAERGRSSFCASPVQSSPEMPDLAWVIRYHRSVLADLPCQV